MAISPSVRPATVNMLNNLLGGWGDGFKKSSPYAIAHVEHAFDDALNPAQFELTEEQRRRQAEDILRQRKFHEEEQERLRQQNDFMRHLEESRPVLPSAKATNTMDNNARELAYDFAHIFQKNIEVSMGVNYAKKMLSQDLGLDISTTNFPHTRIMNMTRDISTIPVISLLCKHLGLTNEQTNAIMSRELGKLYEPKPKTQDKPLAQVRDSAGPGPLMGNYQRKDYSFPSNPFKGNSNVTQREQPAQRSGDIGHVSADSRDDGQLSDMIYELLKRGVPE